MKFLYGLLPFLAASGVVAQGASSQAKVPVVGVKTGVNSNTGERPRRLNIASWSKAPGPAWDLYIQAMAAFQAVAENDEKSYFQITGVHGLPFVQWNGVGQVNGGATQGYCPHSQLLFGTWHRPFLALFEQELVKHAQTIAKKYTGSNKKKYQDAANALRIPYWDWAADATIPSVLTSEKITVTTPSGKKSIRNPLYSYKFQKWPFTYDYFGGTIAEYSQTMRCPSTNGKNAKSQNSKSNSNLQRDAGYLKNSVFLTLTRETRFASMATDSEGGSNNFESPHNVVHDDLGCGNPTGHMYNLGWSAFDPIFMLHHANVDRLIAMWQAIHYHHEMFTGSFKAKGMYGTAGGSTVTANTGLKPFYKSGGNSFWTSKDSTSTRAFGYTYPELLDWKMGKEDLKKSVVSKVNQLYGTKSNAAFRGAPGKRDGNSALTQYLAELSVDRADLELPARINVYYNDELAGAMVLLAMPTSGVSTSSVPLQQILEMNVARLSSKPQETVSDLLKDGIKIEVLGPNGSIPAESIPSLKLDLQALDVVPPVSEFELPEYLNTTSLDVLIEDVVDLVTDILDV